MASTVSKPLFSLLTMETLYDRLLEVCRDQGIEEPRSRDIQAVAGISSGRVAQIRSEGVAARLGAAALSAFVRLGYSPDWIQDGRLPKRSNDSRRSEPEEIDPEEAGLIYVARVRFKLSAGVTGFTVDVEDGETPPIFFRKDWFSRNGYRPEALFAVRVSGDSMVPSLFDGDLVVVNTEDTRPRDGEVFAANYEGELVIKRVRLDGGMCWLDSDAADQVRFRPRQCGEGCFIIGRAVYKQSERI